MVVCVGFVRLAALFYLVGLPCFIFARVFVRWSLNCVIASWMVVSDVVIFCLSFVCCGVSVPWPLLLAKLLAIWSF